MEHKEEPFESLTRGLDKDLTPLFVATEFTASGRSLLTAVDPVFARTGLSSTVSRAHREVLAHATETLADRFAQQLAVFPLSNRVVSNEFGVFIPKVLLRNRSHFEYNDELRNISVSIHGKANHTDSPPQLALRNARSWADIPKDDAIYDVGRDPITLDITDASENLDRYLYGGE